MADDAMDWHPTTPPAPYNPYSHPRYIPGGWPRTPPSHRFTSGKFARKRSIAATDRPIKRACTALRFIGNIATLPVRFILQRLRSRQRDQEHTSRRNSAQDRRLSAAQRDRLSRQAEAELAAQRKAEDPARATVRELEQQRLRAERRTPEGQNNNSPFSEPGACPDRQTRRPIDSRFNIETPIATPTAIEPVTKDVSGKDSKRSLKRARKEENRSFEHFQGSYPEDHLFATASRSLKRARKEENQTEYLRSSRPSGHQSVSAQDTSRTPHTDLPSIAEAMKGPRGPNRFEANFKPSPLAYTERHVVSSTHVKPIGTKLGDPNPVTYLFGGYEFEKPIEVTQPALPTPPNGVQLELDNHRSEQANAGLQTPKHEECGSERGSAPAEVHEPYAPEHEESKPEAEIIQASPHVSEHRKADQGIATPDLVHDPRWSNELPLHIFFPEDFGLGNSTQEENIDVTEEAAVASPEASKWSVSRIFSGFSRYGSRPPAIKPRLVLSARYQRALQQQAVTPDVTQNDAIDRASQPESIAVSPAVKEDGRAKAQNSASHMLPKTTKVEEVADVESEAANIIEDDIADAEPVTPLKVIAEKPAEQDVKTPPANVAKQNLETPADKLAKLDIQDNQENDTPKATPHFGTRTARVTRYQEALEKAQKAKLEQYELVGVSNDWDQKVRSAVCNGIPDYLGPHDLARVVPQYSKNGRQDNWLNDETINKYLEIVATHGRKNDRSEQVRSHHAFNNFFYNNLASRGASSVVRWSKRAKIGGKSLAYVEKVFVPINSGAHWTLAVVEPTLKKITHYNSMRGAGIGIKACENLKDWVAIELGKDFKEEEWTLLAVGESPQQTNSDDCGVFTVTSARQIMLGYPPTSYRADHIPAQRVRIVAELINRGLLRSTADSEC